MKLPVCLLIDDDEEECEIFHYAAEELEQPLSFQKATSAREALSLLENGTIRPDLILLDLYMPRVNGRDCLKQLMSLPAAAGIPVFIYSSGLFDVQRKELETLGAQGFLDKTGNIPDLTNGLRTLLLKVARDKAVPDQKMSPAESLLRQAVNETFPG
jgi:CheY-like chemotaxis protein